MDKTEEPDGYTGSWCPECGEGVSVDEEGLCVGCGCTAIGRGIETIFEERRENEKKNLEAVSAVRVLRTTLEGSVQALKELQEKLYIRDREFADLDFEREEARKQITRLQQTIDQHEATIDELERKQAGTDGGQS